MIKEAGGVDNNAARPAIVVVEHWLEQLKTRVAPR
jgi:hypothetical protein